MAATANLETKQQTASTGKYLTFFAGHESYGIPVLKVREIIKLTPITAIPQAPDYVKGVINLRGKIIPVVDLRIKFGLATAATTERTCIIVVQIELVGTKYSQLGLIVDGVEEVVNLTAGDIEDPPDFGVQISTDYIVGMAKIKGVVKTLLNIDRAVSSAVLKESNLIPSESPASTNH